MTAMAYEQEDPVARLAQWLAVMDVTSRDTNKKLRSNERNRLNILVAHSVFALAIAPTFMTQLAGPGGMNSPSFTVLRDIPAAPYALAFILGLGGAILLPATIARQRGWELAGLALLVAWYLTMTVCLTAAFIPWTLAGSPPDSRPSTFAPLLYGHICTVLLIHIRTLWRLGRREDTL